MALCMIWGIALQAQIGGINAYHFLNIGPSSRSTALGGVVSSVSDEDIMQAMGNPALLNSRMNHHGAINHRFHIADISLGSVAYGLAIDSTHTMLLGVQYVQLGDFIRADEFGNRDGIFNGSEVAMTIGASHHLDDRLTFGVNLRYVASAIEVYQAHALGADLGLYYYHPDRRAGWGIVLKNIGGQLSAFNLKKEYLPIDLQIGYSKRLRYLPFIFSITARNLQQWKLTYQSELNADRNIINGVVAENGGIGEIIDNFFRHLTFGGELLIGPREGFAIRLGYNHQRNKELSTGGYRSLSGFSIGFGMKVKRLMFNYSYSRYHLAGSSSHVGVNVNFAQL